MVYDVIIVGGGPAGLSAALVLGRSRRSVLVCDSGAYRNACSRASHGYLSRDGIGPGDLLAIGREQLEPYGVVYCAVAVESARTVEGGFSVSLADGSQVRSRKLVLATGVEDILPDIPDVNAFYGSSVHHCPYCDGWEHRDQPISVYGKGKHGFSLARLLLQWSSCLTVITHGPCEFDDEHRRVLSIAGVGIREDRIARLEGADGLLERIVFESGDAIPCRAIFFATEQRQRCTLAEDIGCVFTRGGAVNTDRWEQTNVPGVYVIGDASRDVQFIVVAAAEGAKAAQHINADLQEDDFARVTEPSA